MNKETLDLQNTTENKNTEQYLKTALEAGRIALQNGADSARCDYIIQNIMKSSGSKDCISSVLSTSIIASLDGKTQIITARNRSTNLNKISVTNQIAHQVADGKLDIEEAGRKLQEVNQKVIYGFFLRMLAFVIVMVSMPILMDGTILDVAAAAVCGLIMSFVDALFRRVRIHAFASIVIQTFIMIVCGSLAAFLTRGAIILHIIMTAAITPMFPGLALTNAVRDTLQGDYVSGAGRLLEAFVKALAISFGVGLGLLTTVFLTGSLSNRMMDTPLADLTNNPARFLIYAVAALAYSAGYCILFEVTPRFIIWGALVGCIAKTLCMYIDYLTDARIEILGVFLATLAAAILAQILSRVFKTLAIPFLIAGIMALVPGSALYDSVYTIISGDYAEGAVSLLETIMVAGAIAVAIFLVDTISLTAHRIRRKKILNP